MKFSENWLRSRVDLAGIDREQLLARLTAVGLEVESCVSVAPAFSGVVVARVLDVAQHPNADRLRVCQVDAGDGTPKQIVCGAANVRAGLLAPLAMLGAVLPGDFRIKASKLRGVESAGMLCSADELGIDGSSEGLLELAGELMPGSSLREALDLDDAIIELKLTPNRCDCLGIEGLARELAAVFGRPLLPAPKVATLSVGDAAGVIEVPASADCPRYLGLIVEGIDATAATPDWMRRRLTRSGVGCIHPLVDITNYVMLESGQPMHAFDLDTLALPVVVRRATAGERLTLLDGSEVELQADTLLIADQQGPLAIAGVMGGERSKVTAATRRILFESAHFRPATIMGKARRHGLSTDSAHRFERGVDPDAPARALARAVALGVEIAGGTPGPVLAVESADALPKPARIRLRKARLAAVLGFVVPDAEVNAHLGALGLSVEDAGEHWQVEAPPARFDLSIEADLIEEVARLAGYDRIPTTTAATPLKPVAPEPAALRLGQLRRQLAARGWHEAITLAFTGSALLGPWGFDALPLLNPLSADIDRMRPSLLPALVEALKHNLRRQQSRVRLFETGRVFLDSGSREVERLALVGCGPARAEQWGEARRALDVYDLLGELDALGAASGINLERSQERIPPWLHPGRSVRLLSAGLEVGVVGELHPALLTHLDLRQPVQVLEVDCAALTPAEGAMRGVQLPPKLPSVRRDLALVVSDALAYAALADCIRTAAGALLVEQGVFDQYRGPGVPEGSRSLALRLTFRDPSRTLTDAEVAEVEQRVVAALARECGAIVR
ncbi:MAG: phenylalanine--tRNA ligase subunit beta [Xanthomonadales bacterium]|jgi:phenylalanyl-tRNA synthetase beta chain|nr:phenylalanine--tRNA ligase subunit beta [Xanthomonadales bacterium]